MLNKSDYFILLAAIIAMLISIWLWFTEDQEAGIFVAIWVPTILGFGGYIKFISKD